MKGPSNRQELDKQARLEYKRQKKSEYNRRYAAKRKELKRLKALQREKDTSRECQRKRKRAKVTRNEVEPESRRQPSNGKSYKLIIPCKKDAASPETSPRPTDKLTFSYTKPTNKLNICPYSRIIRKRALITGINGQDGSYLAEFLLAKGYIVHGMMRRESSLNDSRLAHLYDDRVNQTGPNFEVHYGDLTDANSLNKLIATIQPHEVYNLAAQSHVKTSFDIPELTGDTNALGTLRLLEAIKLHQMNMMKYDNEEPQHAIKFYQASTSELYGKGSAMQIPQNELTPFYPCSPYGCAKLYAHSLVVNYRESYNMFAVNGILFNHESPRRGENFVTRKISRSVAEIILGRRDFIELGNLDSRRDWGHARDYVEAMWLMLQQSEPKDYVIATGQSHSVREFVEAAFQMIGTTIVWSGEGIDEVGLDKDKNIVRVVVSRKLFRPSEIDHLLGDPSLAKKDLQWSPKISFGALVAEMVNADIALLSEDSLD